MTMAQLLEALGPSERAAVQAVYVEQLTLAAAAARLSVDEAGLSVALAAAFKTVARWADSDHEEAGPGPVDLHPDTTPVSDTSFQVRARERAAS